MKTNSKIRKTGALLLTAAALSVVPLQPAGNILTSLAAAPVTEYDEEALEKFRDNVLEYWEIPGLIEQYNVNFRNELQNFYNNPDGNTGLTRTQLLDLAADLRAEAADLDNEAEDLKDEITKDEYKEYKANVKALKLYAKQLEEASEGKNSAGQSAIRGLRQMRNGQTKDARALMRDYQKLSTMNDIQKKSLEIAELSYQSALRQKELESFTAEDVLNAQEQLNEARAASTKAEADMKSKKQNLLTMLGWSYNADPEIMAVPDADQTKIAGFNPEADSEAAINNNYKLIDKRRSSAGSFGGLDKKNRELQELEDKVKTSLDLLYRDILQKQAALNAADTNLQAAAANKDSADRKYYQLGMISKQEYLGEEVKYLNSKQEKEEADLALTAAIEEYEWALAGYLDIGGTS